MLHQIIYTSAASPHLTAIVMRNIAIKARAQNEALGITGILLFKDGGILQVLEGEKDAVQSLYQKIASDSSHTNLTKLIDHAAKRREFPQWSMGFRMVEESEKLDFAFDLTPKNFKKHLPKDASPELSILTKTYARVHGL